MSVEHSDPRRLIDETDWASCGTRESPGGTRDSQDLTETPPAILRGMLSGDPDAVRICLNYLRFYLIEGPTVYQVAVPVTLCIAATLADPDSRTILDRSYTDDNLPLSAKLLQWLSVAACTVDNDNERRFFEMAGFSPVERPSSTWQEMREIRPRLYSCVVAYLDDRDPIVREAAVVAAIAMLDDPRLERYREDLTPLIKNVVSVSSNSENRRRAIAALSSWSTL